MFGDPARGLGVFPFRIPKVLLWLVFFVFKAKTQLVLQNLSGLCRAFKGNWDMLDALDVHGKTSQLIALGRRYEKCFDREIWIVSKPQELCWFK